MTLSTNPFSKVFNSVSDMIKQGTDSVTKLVSGNPGQAKVDAVVAQYSAAPGTGLNGAAPNLQNREASTRGQTLVTGVKGAANTVGDSAGVVSQNAGAVAGSLQKLGIGGNIVAGLGAIGRTAGIINNFASLARGKSLPAGAELFTGTPLVSMKNDYGEGDWRVRLNCDFDTLFGTGTFYRLSITKGLVFPFTPNMTINSKANYTPQDVVHSNAPFLSYKNSQVEDIQISGDFVVENAADGYYYLEAITFLRTATKMFYGSGEYVGNPPVVCTLSGYGPQILNDVSVVVKGFNLELKDDVSYIKVNYQDRDNWVPIMSTITVTVAPIYSRERLRKFSLANFATGGEVGIV